MFGVKFTVSWLGAVTVMSPHQPQCDKTPGSHCTGPRNSCSVIFGEQICEKDQALSSHLALSQKANKSFPEDTKLFPQDPGNLTSTTNKTCHKTTVLCAHSVMLLYKICNAFISVLD